MPDSSSTLHEIKISELPVAPSVNDADQLEANQAGTSRSITVGQVKALAIAAIPAAPAPISPINAKDYGAIGDWNDTTQTGTDNGAPINAALQYAFSIGGADVLLPVATTGTQSNSTAYYTTQTITVPARCRLLGAGSQSTVSSAVRIVGSLALSPVVDCNGGASGARATGLFNVCITRANGTVPDISDGVRVSNSHYAHLERVLVTRSANAFHVDNAATGTVLRECFSTVVHKAHVLWTKGPMLELDACSFGMSGLDVPCEAYIRIDLSASAGVGCDTLRVIGSQFNQSPVGVGTLLDFRSYADGNGILRFIGCHVEGLAVGTSNVIMSDAASTIIRNLSFESCSINRATATPGPWFACDPATAIRTFSFQNSSTTIDMNLPPNATSIFQIGDAQFTGAFTCTGASVLQLSNNGFYGAVTTSGTITSYYSEGNHFGVSFTDTSTSTKTGFFNGKIGQKSAGSLTTVNNRSELPITGGVVAYQQLVSSTVQSDVTTQANAFATSLATVNSVFTLPTLRHFTATQATFGASSTVTTQQGFYVQSTLAGATNNYGFYSDLAAGTGKWGFYGNGTAQNAFSGLTRFGAVTVPANTVDITGSLGRGAPVVKTADFTVAATENWLANNKAAATCTVTLPAAASFTGREIMIVNYQAFTVVSASANVIPTAGTAAATAILPATVGASVTLVSDGTAWRSF